MTRLAARDRRPRDDDPRLQRPDPTDCLALADACGHALRFDFPGDPSLLRARRAALEACAVIAATDTPRDGHIPERAMLDDTRRMRGAHDHAGHRDDHPRPPRP